MKMGARIQVRRYQTFPLGMLLFLMLSLPCLLKSAVAGQNPPPVMPPAFSAAAVEGLVDNITTDRNADVLKVGYFDRGRPGSLPTDEGYKILMDSQRSEVKGTRRWFMLTSVMAFAAPRVGYSTLADADQIYTELFSAVPPVGAGSNADVVERSLYECLITIGQARHRGVAGGPLESPALLTASLRCALLIADKDRANVAALPWCEAAKATGSGLASFAAARTIAATHGATADPAVRIVEGELLAAASPAEAASFLLAMRKASRAFRPDCRSEYLSALAAALLKAGRSKEALEVAKDEISVAHRGYVTELQLLDAADDEAGISAELQDLQREHNCGLEALQTYEVAAATAAVCSPMKMSRLSQVATALNALADRPGDMSQPERQRVLVDIAQCYVDENNLDAAASACRKAESSYDADDPMGQMLQAEVAHLEAVIAGGGNALYRPIR